eukprot:GHRQ01034967.1.p2 GENE.GHRQ01034967.1~~GHRQ01034967.1.p2  ORF type:complete len:115 (-),score=48.73 GHRQ01034967.1:327-671(-)
MRLTRRVLCAAGDAVAAAPCRGMVESAFEFADICRKHDYHNFVFSMKASNPLVMVQAYRLLAEEQYKRGWDYPLHLGVTGGFDCCLLCVTVRHRFLAVVDAGWLLLGWRQYKRV